MNDWTKNVGMNKYDNMPLSPEQTAAAYAELSQEQTIQAGEPEPATMGAFPGKAKITDPRLS